jgi:hypothetical protein
MFPKSIYYQLQKIIENIVLIRLFYLVTNSTVSPSSNSYTVEAIVPSADATEPPAVLASTHAPTTVEVHTFTTTQSNAFLYTFFLFLFPFDYLFCFSVDHIVFRCSFVVHSIRPIAPFAVYNIPSFVYNSFSLYPHF